jgi:hypothetical protein
VNKLILACVVLIAFSGCWAEKKDHQKAKTASSPIRTYCVGRHLIDLPSSFKIRPITTRMFEIDEKIAQERIFDVVVRDNGLSEAQFAAEVQKTSRGVEEC